MKYIFSILLLFGFVAANAQATYPMRRTSGNAIVTDVALTATEYFRLPTFNASVPNLGTYADSSGRILFNRFDSNILVRNNGAYLFFQPSTKTVNLLGAQTIVGNKTFSGAATFSGTNLFTTLATFNSSIAAGGEINPAVDIKWANNTGFGLKGSDNNRFLSYTTAGGVVVGLSSARVDIHHGATLAVRTTTGGGINVTGTISRTSGTSTQALIADGSVQTLTSGIYLPVAANVSNTSAITVDTAQFMRVGNVVTVSGRIAFTNTLNSPSQISITLPVATVVSRVRNVAGTANENIAEKIGIIRGRTGTNDALLEVDGLNSSTYTIYYTYTYRVL